MAEKQNPGYIEQLREMRALRTQQLRGMNADQRFYANLNANQRALLQANQKLAASFDSMSKTFVSSIRGLTSAVGGLASKGASVAGGVAGGAASLAGSIASGLGKVLPFAIAGLVLVHLNLLHRNGSNNPLGIYTNAETVDFYPYFYVKDLFSILILVFVFSFFVFFAPNMLGHSDNYILGNPMVTPAHIVPEWYFLPFYAVLRSIPDKLGGVAAMFGSIAILFVLPFINMSQNRSSYFRSIQTYTFWFIFFNFILLGWIGQKPVESPYIEIGMTSTVLYFLFFILSNFFFPLLETYLLNFNYKFFDTFHSDSFKFLKNLDSKEPYALVKKYYSFSFFFTTYSKNENSYTMNSNLTDTVTFNDSFNVEKSNTWFNDYL